MRVLVYLVGVLLLGSFSVSAETTSLSDSTKLRLFVRGEFSDLENHDWAAHEREYSDFVSFLKEKKSQYKSDHAFLKQVFYRTHRKFLGEYEQYVTFSEIFSKRRAYDCVTASALYALILDEMGYQYEIRETDYHVYLLVHGASQTFLFETTDALYGFSYDTKEIEFRRNQVLNDAVAYNSKLAMSGVSSEVSIDEHKIPAFDKNVSLTQLAGLHYYNQALRAFNAEDHRKAYQYIIIAQGIYPAARIKQAASLMFAIAFGD